MTPIENATGIAAEDTDQRCAAGGRGAISSVEICAFAHEDCREILSRLCGVFADCGCPVVGFRTGSSPGIECRFEMLIGFAFVLYGGLIDSGLELTQESHRRLTELCVLRKYRGSGGRECVVGVRLVVRWAERRATVRGLA